MKKIFTVLVFVFSASLSFAQISFKDDTLHTATYQNEFEVVGYTKFQKTVATDTDFVWVRTVNTLPSGWSSAVCDVELCRTSTTDSADFVLGSNRMVGDFSFHFYPSNNKGKGSMTVVVYSKANRKNSTTIVVFAETWGLGIASVQNSPYVFFPSPANEVLNVNGISDKDLQVRITDVVGNIVNESVLNSNDASINISNLSAGTYFVRFSDGDILRTQKIIKQ